MGGRGVFTNVAFSAESNGRLIGDRLEIEFRHLFHVDSAGSLMPSLQETTILKVKQLCRHDGGPLVNSTSLAKDGGIVPKDMTRFILILRVRWLQVLGGKKMELAKTDFS